MPAGREDVGEEGEVGFVRGAGREGQGVEVGVGDAEVLGLDSLVVSDGLEWTSVGWICGVWRQGGVSYVCVCVLVKLRDGTGAEVE